MDKKELKDKVLDGMDKFVETSKKALGAAGDAVQDFSSKSVILIEKTHLESKLSEQYKLLGKHTAARLFADENTSVTAADTEAAGILAEINALSEKIDACKAQLETKNKA
ncbi:MAG: hypothetical protein ACTTKL_07135 [Treponema sp.]